MSTLLNQFHQNNRVIRRNRRITKVLWVLAILILIWLVDGRLNGSF